jgi:cytochrome d ubiquinol oxidase subunit II
LQARARAQARIAGIATLVLIGIVSIWTPFLDPVYFERWFTFPTAAFSVLVPFAVLLLAFVLFNGLSGDNDWQPFVAALGIFMLCFAGIGISFYPHIVPPSLTIAEAAAPDSSLAFLLVGAAVLVPVIIAYTAYAYWVFRGKVRTGEGYH